MTVYHPSQDYGSVAQKVWPWSMTRGALAVIFGILGFVWLLPSGSLRTFAMVIGIFAILDGVANGVEAARRRGVPMVLRGVAALVGVVYGVLAMTMSGMGLNTMIWMTAGWAFVIGGLEIVSNLLERGSGHRDWMFGLIMGAVAVVFAVVVVIMMPSLEGMLWLVSIATVLWGIAALIMGGSERNLSHTG